MRPVLSCCALLVALFASPVLALGPYRAPRPETRTLDNGLRVVVFPDPRVPLVAVDLRIPAGVVDEPGDQGGIANVTARMLGRGTTSRPAATFARDLARLGTTLAVEPRREFTTVRCTFLSRDFENGVELIGDAVSHPVFLEEEFRRAANQAGRAVAQLHQDPLATAAEQLWTLALPDQPAARPPLGRLQTMGPLTRDQTRAFHRDHYRPGGAVLAIAGDVTPERAFSAATQWFGSWVSAPPPSPPAAGVRASGSARVRIVDQPSAAGCAVAVGLIVPGRSAADALARSVAATVLEQRLAARFGSAAMGRDARSVLELTRDAGLWFVEATGPVDSALVLARRLEGEIARFLAAPPAPAEASGAQNRIQRGFPLAFETAEGLLSQWQAADFAGFPADYFDTYGARVLALTPASLHAAARREADSGRALVVAIGPARRLEPLLRSRGAVEVVTLDPLPGSATPADTLPPPTAEQVAAGRRLAAHALAAHGGREKFEAIRTSMVDASIRLQVPGNELLGSMRQLRKLPDKLALVTSLAGLDTRQVLNGNRTWTVMAETDTVQEGDSLEVATLRVALISDLPHLLLAANDPQARVAARGRDRIAGREVVRLEVVLGNDPWRMLFLDAVNHRLAAFEQRERGPRGYYVSRSVYSDYRPLDGIQWPYHEERFIANQPLMELDVNTVEFNLQLDERHFEPPKAGLPSWR